MTLFGTACSSGPTEDAPTSGAELSILSDSPAPDTIGAGADTVELELRDADGRPVEGSLLSLESRRDDDTRFPFVYILPLDGSAPEIDQVTTDVNGRARFLVYRGLFSGSAWLHAKSSEFAVRDSIRFDILPGSAERIRMTPADTAVIVGNSVVIDADVLDRADNVRPEKPDLSADSQTLSLGSATAPSVVAARDYGRASVRASILGLEELAWVSVVPDGTLAAIVRPPPGDDAIVVVTIRTDGSEYEEIYVTDNLPQTLDWAPDGQSLFVQMRPAGGGSYRIHELALDGTVRRFLNSTVGDEELHPRYSGYASGRIYYAVDFILSSGSHEPRIWRARTDGTNAEEVGPVGDFPGPAGDNQRLTLRTPEGLGVFDAASGEVQSLGVVGSTPTWSPASDIIAFRDDDYAVNLIRPDGTERRVVAEGPLYSEWIDWSPDGRWIVVGRHPSEEGGLTIIDAVSETVLPLAFSGRWWRAAWQP